MFKLTLVDPRPELCDAWTKHFEGLPVGIICGKFEKIAQPWDCIITAGNSFGIMDGGVDLAVNEFFEEVAQVMVQQWVLVHHSGELPVGACELFWVSENPNRMVAYAPTMRIPMSISGTENVYYAMKAALSAVNEWNRSGPLVKHVLCPGLGTGAGGMLYEASARQMALAYRNFLNPPKEINWLYAMHRHKAILGSK